mgnify:CR=1 FL=1
MDKDTRREKMKIEWVTMNMRLSGSLMNEDKAAKIAGGEYVLDATLEEHLMVTRLMDVLPLMESLLDLQEELSVQTLGKFYQKLSGGEEGEYRRSTPILFHLSYNPVLPPEIEGELQRLFARLHDGRLTDPLARAVHVHNHLIRVYPYDQYSEVIARTAMEYELLYSGQAMIPLTLTESEYNGALAEFLKKGTEAVIYENLRLNKLMQDSRNGC